MAQRDDAVQKLAALEQLSDEEGLLCFIKHLKGHLMRCRGYVAMETGQ